MSGLGTMMTGGKRTHKHAGAVLAGGAKTAKRQENDFYPTPADCVTALLVAEAEPLTLHRTIWEPACGDGAICHVLHQHGFTTVATDLIDRGHGKGGKNFLTEVEILAPAIITNPPFCLAEEFVRHALDLGAEYVAMLLKSTWFHASSRYPLFLKHQPTAVYPLTWRPDFLGQGAPTMEACWFVWDKSRAQKICKYCPLPRPAGGLIDMMEE